MSRRRRSSSDLLPALGFLVPNLVGFLTFVLLPLGFSLYMAFSDWDLRQHNIFRDARPQLIGLTNFTRLLEDALFWQALGNTLFLMMGIPLAIAGALGAALLLHRSPRAGGRAGPMLVVTALLIGGATLLVAAGAGASATSLLIVGVAGVVLVGGPLGGSSWYRTLFYMPHFIAGVATFLLWKKLFAPATGPINAALSPLVDAAEGLAAEAPGVVIAAGYGLLVLAALVAWRAVASTVTAWVEGELGGRAAAAALVLLLVPAALLLGFWGWPLAAGFLIVGLVFGVTSGAIAWRGSGRWSAVSSTDGIGNALLAGGISLTLQLSLCGLAAVALQMPAWARLGGGLEPPNWLTDYQWAKPSLMLVGLWASVGSNSMLLYLAGLSGVQPELYEAASIDGAGRWQTFRNVTWPQLAPVTFFIVVMAVIGGLQGGFEMAKAMTNGGPAGATTTLSFFIYEEGFETGRLGYASAAAWLLFLLIFTATLVNWRFGNERTGD